MATSPEIRYTPLQELVPDQTPFDYIGKMPEQDILPNHMRHPLGHPVAAIVEPHMGKGRKASDWVKIALFYATGGPGTHGYPAARELGLRTPQTDTPVDPTTLDLYQQYITETNADIKGLAEQLGVSPDKLDDVRALYNVYIDRYIYGEPDDLSGRELDIWRRSYYGAKSGLSGMGFDLDAIDAVNKSKREWYESIQDMDEQE